MPLKNLTVISKHYSKKFAAFILAVQLLLLSGCVSPGQIKTDVENARTRLEEGVTQIKTDVEKAQSNIQKTKEKVEKKVEAISKAVEELHEASDAVQGVFGEEEKN